MERRRREEQLPGYVRFRRLCESGDYDATLAYPILDEFPVDDERNDDTPELEEQSSGSRNEDSGNESCESINRGGDAPLNRAIANSPLYQPGTPTPNERDSEGATEKTQDKSAP